MDIAQNPIAALRAARAAIVGHLHTLAADFTASRNALVDAITEASAEGLAVPDEIRLLVMDPSSLKTVPSDVVPAAPSSTPTAPTASPPVDTGTEMSTEEVRTAVLAAIKQGDQRAAQVATRIWGTPTGVRLSMVHSAFAALVKSKQIVNVTRGVYALAPSATTPTAPAAPAAPAAPTPEVPTSAPSAPASTPAIIPGKVVPGPTLLAHAPADIAPMSKPVGGILYNETQVSEGLPTNHPMPGGGAPEVDKAYAGPPWDTEEEADVSAEEAQALAAAERLRGELEANLPKPPESLAVQENPTFHSVSVVDGSGPGVFPIGASTPEVPAGAAEPMAGATIDETVALAVAQDVVAAADTPPETPEPTGPIGTNVRLLATGAVQAINQYTRVVSDSILPEGTQLSASTQHKAAANAAPVVPAVVGHHVAVISPTGMVFRGEVLA